MKRIFVLILLVSTTALSYSQNPFKDIGIPDSEIPVLTLSKGEFEEFHDQERFVQIGSVLFDTETMHIAQMNYVDTAYGEATLEPEVTSRWLTNDPLRQYASPYVGMGNNPVNGVDPDGAWVKGAGLFRNLFNSDQMAFAKWQAAEFNASGMGAASVLDFGDQGTYVQMRRDAGELGDFVSMHRISEEGSVLSSYGNYVAPNSYDFAHEVKMFSGMARSEVMSAVALVYASEGVGAGVSAGLRSINWLGARGGYGIFGKSGLNIRGYKIEMLHGYGPGVPGGTIFSLKQMKQGGSLIRLDYGMKHGTNEIGLHSTIRFHWNGVKYGSTAQRTWYPSSFNAPFFKKL